MKSIPTQQDINLPAGDKPKPATPLSAMDDLIAERKRLEQYTQEQHNRLNRLRELSREEKAAADKQLEEKRQEIERLHDVSGLKAEIDSLKAQLQERQPEIDKLKSGQQTQFEQFKAQHQA